MSHRGFDPILGLLIRVGFKSSTSKIKGIFAEYAKGGGIAGTTKALICNDLLIKWQTATEHGRDHKTKELMGRGVSCKYTWADGVKKRHGIKRTVLILDGTWQQDDSK